MPSRKLELFISISNLSWKSFIQNINKNACRTTGNIIRFLNIHLPLQSNLCLHKSQIYIFKEGRLLSAVGRSSRILIQEKFVDGVLPLSIETRYVTSFSLFSYHFSTVSPPLIMKISWREKSSSQQCASIFSLFIHRWWRSSAFASSLRRSVVCLCVAPQQIGPKNTFQPSLRPTRSDGSQILDSLRKLPIDTCTCRHFPLRACQRSLPVPPPQATKADKDDRRSQRFWKVFVPSIPGSFSHTPRVPWRELSPNFHFFDRIWEPLIKWCISFWQNYARVGRCARLVISINAFYMNLHPMLKLHV